MSGWSTKYVALYRERMDGAGCSKAYIGLFSKTTQNDDLEHTFNDSFCLHTLATLVNAVALG
jgi:hypothetical protein